MAAVVIQTRRRLTTRLWARVRTAYLRWLVSKAEGDLALHKAELQHALEHWPAQIDLDNTYIDALTKQLSRAMNDR